MVTHNVWQLPEGGDFEALHCQPSTNFDRSTKLDLTTEPPLLGRCCVCPASAGHTPKVFQIVQKYKFGLQKLILGVLFFQRV
jgi:hypothetical protein